MGSRNTDGLPRVFSDIRVYHQGSQIRLTSLSGVDSTNSVSDDSIEYSKNITSSGNLGCQITRAEGIHTSVSTRGVVASGTSLGPMNVMTERKVFFIDNDRNLAAASQSAWKIFDASGNAVGSASGTTDTDITPKDT